MKHWLVVLLPAAVVAQERAPLRLTLKRAVELAVSAEGSARIQVSEEAVQQAQSRSAQARAALLPNLDASLTQQSVTRNLEAMGIRFSTPIPGLQFPRFVGPFNVFDVRAGGTQSVFDFSAIRRFQASRTAVQAARSERENAGEQVAAQVARAYLAALRAEAQVAAVKANIELAEAVARQAEDQKKAGTGTGIEISRARVQLANERQRLLVAENDRRRGHLQLLRAMGQSLETPIELAGTLEYLPAGAVTLEAARAQAAQLRFDLKAQQEREQNARLAASATRLERLPSLAAFADYGSIGTSALNALPTRSYGLSLRLPLFDGGRRDARRAESRSQHRQETIRTEDLKDQIELEIRLALDALRSAEQQVQVAGEGLSLAEDELAHARRRYGAGVAAGLEVTDAQTRLERARDNRIAALFNYNLARIELAQATGTVRKLVD